MKHIKKCNQDGFTLIETIVAIVIITVGLLMLAHLMTVSIVLNEKTESDLKSIQLAQGKLESLKAQFNSFVNTGDLPGDLSSGSHGPETVMIQTDDTDTQNSLYFDISWSVTDLSGGMKQVTLAVNPMSYQTTGGGDDIQSVNPVTITSVLAP
jgi:prepilin-type N-terminal cleavage/methylation domain-containing protein